MDTLGQYVSVLQLRLVNLNEIADALRSKIKLIESTSTDRPAKVESRLHRYRRDLSGLQTQQMRLDDSWFQIVVEPFFKKLGRVLGSSYFSQILRTSKTEATLSYFQHSINGTQGFIADIQLVNSTTDKSLGVTCCIKIVHCSGDKTEHNLSMQDSLSEITKPLRAA